MSDSLQPHGLYSPWNSPGQNTGVSSCSLLQGIFPTWDWTQVSHIAGRFFTSWATREAHTQILTYTYMGFPGGWDSRACLHAGDPGLIPGLGRFPGEGNGYLPQYSCLENSMEKEFSLWDPKELDMTEWLTHTHRHTHPWIELCKLQTVFKYIGPFEFWILN